MSALLVCALFALVGCSTILGADFDRAPHQNDGSESGGSSSAGATSGGADASGGEASGAGTSAGGTSAGGGAASGGAAAGTGGQSSGGAQNMGGASSQLGGRVFINELNPFNSDYIELYNAGDVTAYLEGATLTDGVGMPNAADTGAPFGKGVAIEPHGFLLVEAGPYLGFTMGQDATTIYLLDASDLVVDSLEFPGKSKIVIGLSYGRTTDGGKYLDTIPTTPGQTNNP